ncbi:MAG: type II secretion system F family protein [Fimbriimonadaceae bacterium]|nr:type II secretion system F family protein [Fimbriimonadaceae bacterium]
MTTYAYVAVEPSGKRRTGFIEAASRDAAVSTLSAQGQVVLEIDETKAAVSGPKQGGRSGRITRSDLALFTRRLADLADAGLPLDRVLQVVAEQSESGRLTHIAEQALEDVRGGLPVSDALAKHPRYFNAIFTETLKAGEASGQFPEVATRLADFQEREVARRSQVVSALVYPGILSTVAVLVVVFLLTFVVPRLSGVFKDLGSDLPLTTKMLLGFTGFLTQNGLLILGVLAGSFIAYRAWIATDAGAKVRDRALMGLPLVGPVVQKAVVSRYARVLGTLVFGGVPILESLRLAGMAAGNRVFLDSSVQVEEDVREGRPIAQAMHDSGAFPPVLTHMVAIGEETGDLPKMLNRVSDSLDFEVDTGLRRLTTMVEPIIVLLMAVFVGFVVLSVVLPIFQAQELVK